MMDMAQQTQNLMKEIRLEKVVLNMGVGKSGDAIQIAKMALDQISGKKSLHSWYVFGYPLDWLFFQNNKVAGTQKFSLK